MPEATNNSGIRKLTPRLLVLDSSPEMAHQIARVSGRAGYASHVCQDYRDFQRRYDSDISIVIIDLMLQNPDGVEIIARPFRAQKPCRRIVDQQIRPACSECCRTPCKGPGAVGNRHPYEAVFRTRFSKPC